MLRLLLALSLFGTGMVANANQSTKEKAKAKWHDAKRTVKKDAHRIEEKVCAKGDVKCAEEKAKHRLEEGKDYVKDKGQETKDSVDQNGD